MLLNVEYVRQLMIKNGWTERELAKKAGLSPATVSRVLSKKRGAGTRTMAGIRKAFPAEPADRLFFLR